MLCKPWMKALTVLLCFLLFFTALACTVVLDIRLSTSGRNIRRIVKAALAAPVDRPGIRFLPAARLPLSRLAPSRAPEPDITESDNELVAWICQTLEEQYGGQLNINAEQIGNFVEKSTLKDFLSDKSAEYVTDLLNGTEKASITAEEINRLLEENAALIEAEFDIPLTDEVRGYVMDFVEEQDVNTVIREQVIESVRNMPIGSSDSTVGDTAAPESQTTVADILDTLRDSTSWLVFGLLTALLLAICAGLFFTTGRSIVKTLRYAGIPVLVLGILLALPTLGVQLLAGALLSGVAGQVADVILGITAAVHYSVLALGIILLVAAGIVSSRMKKKAQPEPAAQ